MCVCVFREHANTLKVDIISKQITLKVFFKSLYSILSFNVLLFNLKGALTFSLNSISKHNKPAGGIKRSQIAHNSTPH